jgi:hypothetical protein
MTNRSSSAEITNSYIANMTIDEDGAVHHYQQQDCFEEEEEISAQDEEEEEEEDDDLSSQNLALSHHDLLQEKLERIAYLENAEQIQHEHLETMQQERLEESFKNKQQVYWLQLELDNTRRDKVASEERMAELYQDLMHQEESTDITGSLSAEGDSAELVQELQAKVYKYEQTFGILDNQINMVKTSCDQVVKTLKEEIADLMDDRCRMEMDLLNQLASLDNEKLNIQLDLQGQIQVKNEMIARLRKQNGDNDPRDVEELENELAKLRRAKKEVEEILRQEELEADDHIQSLEEANVKLERKLGAATDDLEVMRSSCDTQETVKALDRITKEREEIDLTLERVAHIWGLADASVQSLEEAMDQLRPTNDVDLKGDRARLLSTLESASLVHGQVKVSLLLVEIKMRNQLTSLKNDNLTMDGAGPSDQEGTKQMQRIQKDAMSALKHVEGAMSERMRQMEERTLEETKSMKQALEQRTETLQSMQQEHKQLQEEIARMKESANSGASPVTIRNIVSTDDGLKSPSPMEYPILSGQILDQLQAEVVNVVERVHLKNDIIQALQANLKEYANREHILKKELKRAIRGSSKPGEPNRTIKSTKVSTPPASPSKKSPRVERAKLEASAASITNDTKQGIGLSPLGKPKESVVLCKTPVATIKPDATAKLAAPKAPSPLKTPVATTKPAVAKTISPLPPSPRELLSNAKYSPTARTQIVIQ